MWTVDRCIVFTGIRLLFLIRPCISSVFFLSVFRHFFSGTVRLKRLKLSTHMDSGQMYHVYWNQATATYSSLYFFNFLSLNFHFFLFLQFSVHNMFFSSDNAIAGL